MPSSHRRHRQDKTVLSCWHLQCELNWRQVKTVINWKFWNSFVQSPSEVWTVLSCPDPVSNLQGGFLLWRHIWKTSSQMRSHRRRHWTKLFSLQYIEDYWKLSATVTNSIHTADETRDSLVLLVVWTRHYSAVCLAQCLVVLYTLHMNNLIALWHVFSCGFYTRHNKRSPTKTLATLVLLTGNSITTTTSTTRPRDNRK